MISPILYHGCGNSTINIIARDMELWNRIALASLSIPLTQTLLMPINTTIQHLCYNSTFGLPFMGNHITTMQLSLPGHDHLSHLPTVGNITSHTHDSGKTVSALCDPHLAILNHICPYSSTPQCPEPWGHSCNTMSLISTFQ